MVNRRKLFWLLLGVVVSSVGGAALAIIYFYTYLTPKSAAELCGTFVHDADVAYQELTLRDAGTFTQTVLIKATSEVVSSTGTWRYSTRVKSGMTFGDVVFDQGFMNVLSYAGELNPDYAHPKPVIVLLPAEYHFGKLILWQGESGPQWEKVKVNKLPPPAKLGATGFASALLAKSLRPNV